MIRRDFLKHAGIAALASGATGAAGLAPGLVQAQDSNMNESMTAGSPKRLAVSSANGLGAVERTVDGMGAGESALDAAIAGVNLVEEDPNDMSVGYGGLPNEDGDVELDASVMDGPTHNAGAVGGLRGIMYPSRVAKLVMERSDHVLLMGEGAVGFARAHGFEETDLLTDRARRVWLAWKEMLTQNDDWLPPDIDEDLEPWLRDAYRRYQARESGTINCCALNADGSLAGVTTTSGLAFKIPGHVGDSPIIGAGLYVDNEVGACGSTGRGEANLLNLSSFLAVEEMKRGASPVDAGLAVCQRIVEHNHTDFLRREDGNPNFDVKFYLVSKSGEYAGCAIYGTGGGKFSVCDENGARHEDLTVLLEA